MGAVGRGWERLRYGDGEARSKGDGGQELERQSEVLSSRWRLGDIGAGEAQEPAVRLVHSRLARARRRGKHAGRV